MHYIKDIRQILYMMVEDMQISLEEATAKLDGIYLDEVTNGNVSKILTDIEASLDEVVEAVSILDRKGNNEEDSI